MERHAPSVPDRRISALRRRLLAWYDREKRRLPWRGTRDPYRIWVSEIMLQQTTVEAVRRRYPAFLARFPNVASLARAREDSVLAAWSGLGYYARARNLKRAAREILRRHAGSLPREPEALRRLPGFGEYTAAAVASLAYGVRAPAADANVTRVVSRLHAIPGRADSRRHRSEVLERVGRMLVSGRPGDLTAALMDLGQGICTPRRPACERCPVESACEGRRQGNPEAYPGRRPKPEPVRMAVAAAFFERDGRALLLRRRGGFLDGLWEFPSGPATGPSRRAARAGLTRTLSALGLSRDPEPVASVRHTVVNRRLEIEVFRARASKPPLVESDPAARWFSSRQLARAAIPTLTRKIARSVGFL
ncbi:MAG: A/G-specific adenine glycosylase [Acidobacteriota bacterium]